jgi:hypothetical protein
MATLQELIDRATDIAAGAIDGPLQDAEMLAQSLLPGVFHDVVTATALDPFKRTIFKRTFTVPMVAGVGTLDDSVLTAYVCEAITLDTDGDYGSWIRYDNFVRPLDNRLAHFSIKEAVELHYRPVGGGVYSADLDITIAAVPVLPALLTDQLPIPEEELDDVIRALATSMVASLKAVA